MTTQQCWFYNLTITADTKLPTVFSTAFTTDTRRFLVTKKRAEKVQRCDYVSSCDLLPGQIPKQSYRRDKHCPSTLKHIGATALQPQTSCLVLSKLSKNNAILWVRAQLASFCARFHQAMNSHQLLREGRKEGNRIKFCLSRDSKPPLYFSHIPALYLTGK